MTAPVSIPYEDWKATVDAANEAIARAGKLKVALSEFADPDNWEIYEHSETAVAMGDVEAIWMGGGNPQRKAAQILEMENGNE